MEKRDLYVDTTEGCFASKSITPPLISPLNMSLFEDIHPEEVSPKLNSKNMEEENKKLKFQLTIMEQFYNCTLSFIEDSIATKDNEKLRETMKKMLALEYDIKMTQERMKNQSMVADVKQMYIRDTSKYLKEIDLLKLENQKLKLQVEQQK